MNKLKLGVAAAATLLMTMGSTSFAQSGGEAVYKAKCQMCHGATGAGDTPAGKAMKAKSFHEPDVEKMSAATLEGITKNGLGKMPAYKDKLSDGQIKDVVMYIKTLQKK